MAGPFEWDEAKNRANRAKHGISFEEAQAAFDGPVLTARDDRYNYGEQRFISYGQLGGLVVVVVAHTTRGERTRLISARKANRKESQTYYEHLEATAETD
jgi:uncharacterized DUF497 family protein